jgi:hypothetical protein
MKRVVALFSVLVLIVLSLPIVAIGYDGGCVNGDCPTDPGCTDGGCAPGDDTYKAGCCCAEPDALPNIRICCCKSDMVVQCRETYGQWHLYMDEVRICMGQLPSRRVGSTSGPCGTDKALTCAPDWFPSRQNGFWWPEDSECGWMNQIDKCANPKSRK